MYTEYVTQRTSLGQLDFICTSVAALYESNLASFATASVAKPFTWLELAVPMITVASF